MLMKVKYYFLQTPYDKVFQMMHSILFVLYLACVGGFSLENDNILNKKGKSYMTVSQYMNDRQIQQNIFFVPFRPSETFTELEKNRKGTNVERVIKEKSNETEAERQLKMIISDLSRNCTDLQHQFALLQCEVDVLKHTTADTKNLNLRGQINDNGSLNLNYKN